MPPPYLPYMDLPKGVYIKENSWVAKMAAYKLKCNNVAIVFGNTIHLYGATRHQFLQKESWVKHELQHVAQYKQNGYLPFLCKYLLESVKRGYQNNRFEVEAREAERKM